MLVSELRELLANYDGDREIVVTDGTFWKVIDGVRSIEPGGAVFLNSGDGFNLAATLADTPTR